MSTVSPQPAPPPRRRSWVAVVLPVVVLGAAAYFTRWSASPADPTEALAAQGKGARDAAPELDGGIAWLNTDTPLSLADLKGKIVLLDFWTLCCINCIHTLPDLEKLEQKYGNQLVVIGVHSPKFPRERNTESIRKAVLRYEISHPVVNDANMAIWSAYGVRAWPTLVLIDPEGKYYGHVSGEGRHDVL